MGTIIRKCEFGIVHSRDNCRCPGIHETVRQIKCDTPDEHKPTILDALEDAANDSRVLTAPPLHARLHEAVVKATGPVLHKQVVNDITDACEEAVKAWLLNEAERLDRKL